MINDSESLTYTAISWCNFPTEVSLRIGWSLEKVLVSWSAKGAQPAVEFEPIIDTESYFSLALKSWISYSGNKPIPKPLGVTITVLSTLPLLIILFETIIFVIF